MKICFNLERKGGNFGEKRSATFLLFLKPLVNVFSPFVLVDFPFRSYNIKLFLLRETRSLFARLLTRNHDSRRWITNEGWLVWFDFNLQIKLKGWMRNLQRLQITFCYKKNFSSFKFSLILSLNFTLKPQLPLESKHNFPPRWTRND